MDSSSKCVFVRAGKHTSVHDVHPHVLFNVTECAQEVLTTDTTPLVLGNRPNNPLALSFPSHSCT